MTKWWRDLPMRDKVMNLRGLAFILIITGLLLLSQVASADWRLDVWDKTQPIGSVPPLKTKRFIAFTDCRDERIWLDGLATMLEGKPVYITCFNLDLLKKENKDAHLQVFRM